MFIYQTGDVECLIATPSSFIAYANKNQVFCINKRKIVPNPLTYIALSCSKSTHSLPLFIIGLLSELIMKQRYIASNN